MDLDQKIHSETFNFSDYDLSIKKDETETFFNKKKKRFIFAWGIVFLIVIFVAIKFFLNLSFVSFFSSLKEVSDTPYFLLTMILGFLTFVVCESVVRAEVLKIKLGNKIRKVTKFEWFGFSVISFLIQSVTPFSIGSEPYSIWWLNKKGISLREAGSVVAVTSFCWFVGQFLITWPSFIYMTAHNWSSIVTFSVAKTYWAILAGLCVDIGVAAFIFTISYSRKVHYWVSATTNDIKRYFGFNYSTHDELFQKYLKDNVFQKVYLQQLCQKSTVKVIVWYLFNNIWVYFMFVLVYRLFYYDNWSSEAAFDVYNIINVSTTANNFMPLPSAEGSLQVVIQNILSGIPSSGLKSNDAKDASAIFLWRFFNKYLGFLTSIVFLAIYGFNSDRSWIVRKVRFSLKQSQMQDPSKISRELIF